MKGGDCLGVLGISNRILKMPERNVVLRFRLNSPSSGEVQWWILVNRVTKLCTVQNWVYFPDG
jgi:hypothetical protein